MVIENFLSSISKVTGAAGFRCKWVWHNRLHLPGPGCLATQGWTKLDCALVFMSFRLHSSWTPVPLGPGPEHPCGRTSSGMSRWQLGSRSAAPCEGSFTILKSHWAVPQLSSLPLGEDWGKASPFLHKLRHPFWKTTSWFQAYVLSSSPYSLEEPGNPGRGQGSWDSAGDNIGVKM